ncbi:MAG: PIN domain-containing protein [Patescibacteria group bacterium]
MKLLVDSDFLFGLFVPHDPHHKRSNTIYQKVKNDNGTLYCLGHVLQEVGTVLSHKVDMDDVRRFYNEYPNLDLIKIHLEEALENAAWELFLKQTKKGCSFVDCANLAVIEKYGLDGILSFDTFYPHAIRKT